MHTVTHPDFFGADRYRDRGPMNVSPWLKKLSKYMSTDALKMQSVTMSVLRFSKLL